MIKNITIVLFTILAHSVIMNAQVMTKGGYRAFVENNGQMRTASGEVNTDVLYSTMSPHLNIQLRRTGFSYDCSLKQNDGSGYVIERVDVNFLNTRPLMSVEASDKQRTVINDYRTDNARGVKSLCFKTVVYRSVYPGVDVEFHINRNNEVEYDIIVHPSGKLSDVQLQVNGPSDVSWDNGLVMKLKEGEVRERVPDVYIQETRKSVPLTAELNSNVLSFKTKHDPKSTLVIDPVPVLTWGTYFGGGQQEVPRSIDTHPDGGCVVSGYTTSTTGIATAGSHQSVRSDTTDAFVARFDSSGILLWATYYGGTGYDKGVESIIDNSGNIYVTGHTLSTTGISTPGSFSESLGGERDMFLVKFDRDGIRLWGTYFGKENDDEGVDLELMQNGDVAFSAISGSGGLATAGTNQNSVNGPSDMLLGVFSPDGVRIWATYVGGNGYDRPYGMSLADNDDLVVSGFTGSDSGFATVGAHQTQFGGVNDGFVVRVSSVGVLIWATYVGGSDDDGVYDVTIDQSQNIVTGGETSSSDSIATPGSFQEQLFEAPDAFVVKFDASGKRLWGTYIGGGGQDGVNDIVITNNSEIFIVGGTASDQVFATTPGISASLSGPVDGFLCAFDELGARIWSTYIGGDSTDWLSCIDLDGADHVYTVGYTTSNNFIGTPGTHQENYAGNADAFVMRIALCQKPTPGIQLPDRCVNRNGTKYTTNHVPGNIYQWSFPPEAIIVSGGDSSTCTVLWQQPGQVLISLKETSPLGCDSMTSVATRVFPEVRPDVQSVNGSLEACEGDTIYLKVQDGFFNYMWNTGESTQTLAVTTTGFYQVEASDTMCTGKSDSVSVNFLPKPISDITGPTSICLSGTTTNFYFVVQSVNSQYLWTTPKLGNAVSALTEPTLTVEWTQAGIDTLRIDISAQNGCDAMGLLVVTISDSLMPTISSSTGQFVFCEGDSIYLTADSIVPSASVLWSTGETTYSIVVKQGGTYWVQLDDGTCTGTSTPVAVIVSNATAPMILGSSAVCRTDEDSVVYSVQKTPGNEYGWRRPILGTIVTPLDSLQAISQIIIQWHSAGVDTVAVIESTPGGCMSTAELIVTISEGVLVTISEDNGDLVADFVAADEYQWLNDAMQPISGATGQRFTPSAGGTYYVEVRTGVCWSRSMPFNFDGMQHTDKFSVSDVDFGSLPINVIVNASGGHVNEIIVVNLSQSDIALDSAQVIGEGFVIPNQFPRLLRPGDTSRITVRFLPTEQREYTATAVIYFGSETGFSQLRGVGRDLAPDERITEVILQPDRIEVVPGEVFEVILSIGTEAPTATTAQEYEATLQWDARVLVLVSTPEVFFRTTGREDNYYTAKIPEGIRNAGQAQLIRIPFRAKLGEIDSTVLVFSGAVAFRWKDDTKAFPACRDSVVHVKICREGGKRLITKRNTASIAGIAPHPIDDKASIFIDASGTIDVSMELIDPLGSVVQHRDLGTILGGRSDLQLDMSGLHAGPYILRLNYGDGTTSRLVIRR